VLDRDGVGLRAVAGQADGSRAVDQSAPPRWTPHASMAWREDDVTRRGGLGADGNTKIRTIEITIIENKNNEKRICDDKEHRC